MQTQTIIKDTAVVARVNSLEVGDAYRRLVPKSTYQESRMVLGIVTGVMNNGETVALTALEIDSDYSGSRIVQKVFEADDDLALFPVNDDETQVILEEARRAGERAIVQAEKSLREARERFDALEGVTERIASAQLRQLRKDADARAIEDTPQA